MFEGVKSDRAVVGVGECKVCVIVSYYIGWGGFGVGWSICVMWWGGVGCVCDVVCDISDLGGVRCGECCVCCAFVSNYGVKWR